MAAMGFVMYLGVSIATYPARAQTSSEVSTIPSPSPTASPTPGLGNTPSGRPPTTERRFIRNIIRDQSLIWTAPFRMHGGEVKLYAAFTAGTASLIATDRHTSSWIQRGGSIIPISRVFSEPGAAFTSGGVAAGLYVVGKLAHKRRLTETGLLASEAYLDAGMLVGAIKLVTQRPRPNLHGGSGSFFRGGTSFPSGHSSAAWSVATVAAYEYRKRRLISIGAYTIAAAVALARYSGRAHFMSEIVVGSAIGFYTGRFVYRTRHVVLGDPAVGTPPAKQSKLVPMLAPHFDRRTGTYAISASWTL